MICKCMLYICIHIYVYIRIYIYIRTMLAKTACPLVFARKQYCTFFHFFPTCQKAQWPVNIAAFFETTLLKENAASRLQSVSKIRCFVCSEPYYAANKTWTYAIYPVMKFSHPLSLFCMTLFWTKEILCFLKISALKQHSCKTNMRGNQILLFFEIQPPSHFCPA